MQRTIIRITRAAQVTPRRGALAARVFSRPSATSVAATRSCAAVAGRVMGAERRGFSSIAPTSRPSNVGIVALDVYFPSTYVAQTALEEFDKAGKGKYTIGLGQRNMAFTDDREDINSMAMTAVQNLLEKYNIAPTQIGRLEVGTETILDKSKSVKTTLMNLFKQSGNMAIEGVDTTNACYGGTNALFNSVNWVESAAWDGRYAIAVAGDIAVYEPGPARPTGGAGVVAMLIGPNAPLTLEPGIRSSYFEDAYDFYKPNLESEYPVVDGKLSISCYLRALDSCYAGFRAKFARANNGKQFTLDDAAYACFHSPYTKLVMRSYARLMYNDALNAPIEERHKWIKQFQHLTPDQSYTDKDLTKSTDQLSKVGYEQKVAPTQTLSQELGNSYCGALYCNLTALINNTTDKDLLNQRILMFSYGSGLAASMFSIRVRESLNSFRQKTNIKARLAQRTAIDPTVFTQVLALREKTHSAANYTPVGNTAPLFPGTYRIAGIDKLKRRSYSRV
jgi:hydroxymethylglutaryl-CoA synthase